MSDWFLNHRMDWITETIKVFGFINREHLQKKFDISVPQASMDLREFQKRNPGALEYSGSTKRYEAKERLATGREFAERYHDLTDALQKLCDDFDAGGGVHRLDWLRTRMERLRELEDREVLVWRYRSNSEKHWIYQDAKLPPHDGAWQDEGIEEQALALAGSNGAAK